MQSETISSSEDRPKPKVKSVEISDFHIAEVHPVPKEKSVNIIGSDEVEPEPKDKSVKITDSAEDQPKSKRRRRNKKKVCIL